MGIEIPEEFAAYMQERGCEVHIEQLFGYENGDGEWIDGGEDLCIRKSKLVRGQLYMHALTVSELVFDHPETWDALIELVKSGLLSTISRGEAYLS